MSIQIPKSIRLAKGRYDTALENLRRAALQEYPVGTLLELTMGKARISAEVTDHRAWGDVRVFIRNTQTRVAREFCPFYAAHEVRIISRP